MIETNLIWSRDVIYSLVNGKDEHTLAFATKVIYS